MKRHASEQRRRALRRMCKMVKRILGVALVFALAGCGRSIQPLNVIDTSMIGPVLSSIKREVGIYLMYQNNPPKTVTQPAAIVNFAKPAGASKAAPPEPPAARWAGCAGGSPPNFLIQSVKINFAISQDASLTGGVSATIPLAMTGTSFGLGGTASSDKADTETLEFTEYPDNAFNKNYSDPNAGDPGELALALISLREGLLRAANDGPCFTDLDPLAKPTDPPHQNTFTMGFTLTRQTGTTATLTLTAIGLNAGGNLKSVSGNTITVTFGQAPGTTPRFARVPLRPAVIAKPGR
jgi:hypothetical protein